jgi:prepilin-type N-terminal cleavage/methylation domain-containing protein
VAPGEQPVPYIPKLNELRLNRAGFKEQFDMPVSPTLHAAAPRTREASVDMRNYRMHRRRAMTLLEILVVIGIIGLLVAILVPALTRAREQVRDVSCRSNMKQLINGTFFYVAEHKVLPGTHSLFFFQLLFGGASWPRPAGVTWDGARDRLVGLTYTAAYTTPHHLDPEFVSDVPGKGTIFRYLKNADVYTCSSDKPGTAQDTPIGGGGNGRLSYSLNAYVGYKSPERLGSFTYVADSLDNPLPGGQNTRAFKTGQRVVFAPSSFMLLFEEHPNFHMNSLFPEGNFNGLDRIATRHSPSAASKTEGRTSIGFLDSHVESRIYPAKTEGRELFAEYGQPHFWKKNGPPDQLNMRRFIPDLGGRSPW